MAEALDLVQQRDNSLSSNMTVLNRAMSLTNTARQRRARGRSNIRRRDTVVRALHQMERDQYLRGETVPLAREFANSTIGISNRTNHTKLKSELLERTIALNDNLYAMYWQVRSSNQPPLKKRIFMVILTGILDKLPLRELADKYDLALNSHEDDEDVELLPKHLTFVSRSTVKAIYAALPKKLLVQLYKYLRQVEVELPDTKHLFY